VRLAIVVILLAACRPPGYGESEADAGADAAAAPAPDAAAGPDGAPAVDAALVTCDAAFRLEGYPDATSVWLTGDFVGWAGSPDDGAVALVLGGDGAWTATRSFDAGTYVYKFIVDGTSWIADPGNPDTVDDGFGGINSLYVCD